ncbi:Ca2+-binding RTX toxin-like protein [Pararhizobium capsulatum DSM 1112]|uniref:Ca2+-binding RTX toxin-like protein n=1 Tax=Pararhizobium capsulatum DSM 1112 TaxID=1121113 RepID=A0ABU0BZS6_9HYPH|nr:calcium-binding protein [Pararhizobium capsulatum]MDQ0322940.1 Ca2+-binding RTX toxin-like protein [Pararhizobium capsulatum DSM 1112]
MSYLTAGQQPLNMYEIGFRQYDAGSAPIVEFDDAVATIRWSATEYVRFEANHVDPDIGPIYNDAYGFTDGVQTYTLHGNNTNQSWWFLLEGNTALEALAQSGDGFALFELLINGYPDSVPRFTTLTGGAGSDLLFGLEYDDTLDGNGGNDELVGNEGNDFLLGDRNGDQGDDALDGGPGADRMAGGRGNDTYYVDDSADEIEEYVSGYGGPQGDDQAFTSVSYTLAAEVSVETLSTTDQSGTDAINLTGNELDNWLVGNAGNNNISGGDGDDVLQGLGGGDVLTGGSGNDFFCFSDAHVTQVTDFTTTEEDTIALDKAVFAGLTTGVLTSAAFRIGAAAEDADDRIIYNAATGALTYDYNGVVGGGDTTFAMLPVNLALSNTDFLVF